MDVVIKKLEDIASIQYGFPFNSKLFGETGPIRVLRIRDIKGTSNPTYYTGDYEHDYEVSNGDMLVGMDGEFNCTIWNAGRALLNQRMAKISPRSSVDKTYIYYLLKTKLKLLEAQTTSSTVKHLLDPQLRRIEIPLPPLETQRTIGSILEKADKIRWKREQANQLTNKIIQSVFLKMFGDPVGNPKKWTTEKLGRLAVRMTKGESPKWQGFEYVRDGVLFIRSENVLWGYLDLEEETRIPKEFHDKLERSQLRPRDVLINLVGASIGRAAMVPETITEANINQAVGVITLGPELKPKFLVQFLISPSVQQIIQGGKVEAARANISLGDLRELDVVVPPIDLQDKFVEFTKKLEALRERQAQSEDETGALFHSLMHKAFRGELVT